MTTPQLKRRIEYAIKRYAHAANSKSYSLVPLTVQAGKLYEAHVLSLVLQRLSQDEGFSIFLVNSSFITLKTGHGPINRRYPRFDLFRNGTKAAELWTDIEFISLSYAARAVSRSPDAGEFHELDLVVVDPNITGHPRHDQIWLAVECKDTNYGKNLLREILGIRRELSCLTQSTATRFSTWPRPHVMARPPSCLMVYSTSVAIASYTSPGELFGIDFVHAPI